MKTPFKNKKTFKKQQKSCYICGETQYELLDTHRILPGCEGGKYNNGNCVCLCSSCHRKHHSGLISIKQWCNSTKGKMLFYIDEDGKEQFK